VRGECICPHGWGATPSPDCPVPGHGRVSRVVQAISTLRSEVTDPIPFRRSPQRMVRAWHEKFGQQVRERPDAAATHAEVEYRHQLHQEEVDEIHVAMERRDVVAIADGIADALYVLYGTALSYGIDIDVVMAEVHRSNMTKTFDPARAKYAGKVVVKGEGYEPPEIARVLGLPEADVADDGACALLKRISDRAFVRNLQVTLRLIQSLGGSDRLIIDVIERCRPAQVVMARWAASYEDALEQLRYVAGALDSGQLREHAGRLTLEAA
jgi:predicted HAD superfamily Cof-like phosphohydrolase